MYIEDGKYECPWRGIESSNGRPVKCVHEAIGARHLATRTFLAIRGSFGMREDSQAALSTLN